LASTASHEAAEYRLLAIALTPRFIVEQRVQHFEQWQHTPLKGADAEC
jgi:hypothetical protein